MTGFHGLFDGTLPTRPENALGHRHVKLLVAYWRCSLTKAVPLIRSTAFVSYLKTC